jgi:hypothetical protein
MKLLGDCFEGKNIYWKACVVTVDKQIQSENYMIAPRIGLYFALTALLQEHTHVWPIFEVFMVVTVEIIFSNIKPCSPIEIYRRFDGVRSLRSVVEIPPDYTSHLAR